MNPFTEANQAGAATSTGPVSNLVANQTKEIRRTRYDSKIDHQFSPTHKVFGRFSWAEHRAWKGDYQAQFNWRPLDPNSEPQPVDQKNISFSDILILSPTANNEIRAGYNRRALRQNTLTDGTNWAKQFGIANLDAFINGFVSALSKAHAIRGKYI